MHQHFHKNLLSVNLSERTISPEPETPTPRYLGHATDSTLGNIQRRNHPLTHLSFHISIDLVTRRGLSIEARKLFNLGKHNWYGASVIRVARERFNADHPGVLHCCPTNDFGGVFTIREPRLAKSRACRLILSYALPYAHSETSSFITKL